MRAGGVNSSVSVHWLDSSTPLGLFPEAVPAFTLFSVKHKFLLLLLNLVRGGESVILMGDGRPSSYMCKTMKHDN